MPENLIEEYDLFINDVQFFDVEMKVLRQSYFFGEPLHERRSCKFGGTPRRVEGIAEIHGHVEIQRQRLFPSFLFCSACIGIHLCNNNFGSVKD